MFQTLQGSGQSCTRETELERQREKETSAGAPQQADRQRKRLPHSFCSCQGSRRIDPPVSGRGQKGSAPEGTSWPASWGSCCSGGKIPAALGGGFSGEDSCNADTRSSGPGTSHCCHKATGNTGICKYRLPPTGVMSSAVLNGLFFPEASAGQMFL